MGTLAGTRCASARTPTSRIPLATSVRRIRPLDGAVARSLTPSFHPSGTWHVDVAGPLAAEHLDRLERLRKDVTDAYEQFAFARGLERVLEEVHAWNRLVANAEPWVLAKRNPAALPELMGITLQGIEIFAALLAPVTPMAAQRVFEALGTTDAHAALTEPVHARAGRERRLPLGPRPILFPKRRTGLDSKPRA
jgi:methionyl-tRNA synthetase